MRVGQRLFLAVLPAIVGLLTVAALAYFGEYARQAPEWLVVLAIVASIVSAAIAWRNTHYVAQRVEQLAERRARASAETGVLQRAAALIGATRRAHPGDEAGADELDRIEQLVQQLEQSLDRERVERAAREAAMRQRADEYTALVDDAVNSALHRMDEVRLPLHILLENRFGELNENQEEMIGAARAAAEASDESLRRLRDVVRVDAGTLRLRQERVRLQDVVHSLLPALRALADARHVSLTVDLSPAIPALAADRARLQEALSTMLLGIVGASSEDASVTVEGSKEGEAAYLRVRGGGRPPTDAAWALATRFIEAQGGVLELDDAALRLLFPRTSDRSAHDLLKAR